MPRTQKHRLSATSGAFFGERRIASHTRAFKMWECAEQGGNVSGAKTVPGLIIIIKASSGVSGGKTGNGK